MRGAKAGGGARGRDEALRLIDAAARSAFKRRLGRRAYLALGLLASVWGAASLTAALWDYGATAFYAVLLSVAGLAWPILAWPPSGEPFAAMIRAADPGASVESYLSESYRGGNEALKAAALATLRTADFSIDERAGEGGGAGSARALLRRLPTALLALGLALFVAAQGLSLREGLGYGLGYPDRSALAAARAAGQDAPTGWEADEPPPAEPGAAGEPGEVVAAPRAAGRDAEGSAPLPERRGTGHGLGRDPDGADRRPPDTAGSSPAEAAAGEGAGGDRSASDAPPKPQAPREGVGPAGFEGASGSLVRSPLSDYRARIERLLEERGGLERALGELSSPALAQAALEAYYGSFERRIRLEPAAEPGIQALREAWASIDGERSP